MGLFFEQFSNCMFSCVTWIFRCLFLLYQEAKDSYNVTFNLALNGAVQNVYVGVRGQRSWHGWVPLRLSRINIWSIMIRRIVSSWEAFFSISLSLSLSIWSLPSLYFHMSLSFYFCMLTCMTYKSCSSPPKTWDLLIQ